MILGDCINKVESKASALLVPPNHTEPVIPLLMIAFTEEEKRVFNIIKEYGLSLSPKVTPRLAGGFVRDKLMGISSHDIDVTLDNISGYSFALGLSEKVKDNPSVHKILANPDKSKHLETAIVNLYGFSIDFVHLRSESYSTIRIPDIRAGTPEEDANRRDITINSLFYNLVTDEIEDFTGRGIMDIKRRIIDTPLDPEITLFDDPLRILRIFRFKSRFAFEISKRIYKALGSQKIQAALETKVSSERIGTEIFKMLDYKNWHEGLLEIVNNGYVHSIFKPRDRIPIDKSLGVSFYQRFSLIWPSVCMKLQDLRINQRILKLYVILQYFLNMKARTGKAYEYMNVVIMKESLKSSRTCFSLVRKIEESVEYLRGLQEWDPVDIVLTCRETWPESLVLLFASTGNQRYQDLIYSIFEKKCEKCYLTAPLVNGDYLIEKEIAVPRFKKMLKECLSIQIKNPGLSREAIFEIANKPHQKA